MLTSYLQTMIITSYFFLLTILSRSYSCVCQNCFFSIMSNHSKNSVEIGSLLSWKSQLLIDNAIIHEEINQVFTPWTTQWLCEQIGNICIVIFICNPIHSRSHGFSTHVICYKMMFLFNSEPGCTTSLYTASMSQ